MPVHLIRLWGCSPVQAEGYVSRHPFYFRARGHCWQFAVATGAKPHRYAAIDVTTGEAKGFLVKQPYGAIGGMDASAMPYEEARQIIEQCALAFQAMEKGRI
jgi:hypothetical protein